MEELKFLLGKTLKATGAEKQIQAAIIVEEYQKVLKDIFGDHISELARPLYVRNSILTVACMSSSVSQELKLHERQVFKKLSALGLGGIIKGFRYQM